MSKEFDFGALSRCYSFPAIRDSNGKLGEMLRRQADKEINNYINKDSIRIDKH